MTKISPLLWHMPDAVVIVDYDQRIRFANPAAQVAFEYELPELVGTHLDILIPEMLRSVHCKHFERFIQGETTSLHMHDRLPVNGRRKNGSLIPMEVSIVKEEFFGAPAVVAVLRDISQQVAREAEVRASEQKYRGILEGSPDAVLIAEAETGVIVEANDSAGRLFGCEKTALVGRHQSELHPAETREKFRATFQEHIREGRILVPDGEIIRDDGRRVPVEICAKPISIGGKAMLAGFFRDISHRIESEAALARALAAAEGAVKAKSVFLANMSHELRTPLNGIIGFSEIIESELHGINGNPKYREYAAIIRDSGRHLLEIINDILDASTLELGKYKMVEEEVLVADVVDDVCALLRMMFSQAEVRLVSAVDEELTIRADHRSVRQMLLNLLGNALKHTPRKGRVTIKTVCERDGISIQVEDTGRGISPERIAVVLEPFNAVEDVYSRQKGGIGLGLAITKALIEMHGGRIELRSRLNLGTEVSLKFPLERVVVPCASENKAPERLAGVSGGR